MMTMTNHYLKAALAALMALALAASLLAQFAKPATAALTREALAWGNGPFGELGNGTTSVESPPVEVSNLGAVKAISAGCNHALALQEDGTVWAWGDNSLGQLGNGTSGNGSQGPDTFSNVPVKVSNLSGVKAISAGCEHNLALKADGTVWAWGRNDYGRLGNGTTDLASTPVEVSNLDGVKAISAGNTHSLALKEDGTVRAWGYNYYGQLGNATVSNYRKTPVVVKTASGATLGNVRSIAASSRHSLALKEDGTIRA